MGYEVLGHGSDAGARHDVSSRPSPRVDELDGPRPPEPAPARDRRRPPRALAITVVALAVVGGLAASRHDTSPRPDAGTAVAQDGLPVLSARTDLTSAVTVAHVFMPGRTADEQVSALEDAFARSPVHAAGVSFVPESHDFEVNGAVGVTVVFDRYLDSALQRDVTDVIAQVGPQETTLETVQGTAVDISVPVPAGAPCLPAPGDRAVEVTLPASDVMALQAFLPGFRLRRTSGHATITYVGPESSVRLRELAGDVLARGCSRPVAEVTYTRPSDLT